MSYFQAVGCALNVFGFGESMANLISTDSLTNLVGADNAWAARGFAIGAVLLLGTINVAGVKWVIKLQFLLLVIILLAAIDFFVGSITCTPESCEYFQYILLVQYIIVTFHLETF